MSVLYTSVYPDFENRISKRLTMVGMKGFLSSVVDMVDVENRCDADNASEDG